MTSIANPLGCHFKGSCRNPNMVVISGNMTLMARAAQMVLTCNPFSDATPAGNANGTAALATGALAASNAAASAGPATFGAPAGTDARSVGLAAAGVSMQH